MSRSSRRGRGCGRRCFRVASPQQRISRHLARSLPVFGYATLSRRRASRGRCRTTRNRSSASTRIRCLCAPMCGRHSANGPRMLPDEMPSVAAAGTANTFGVVEPKAVRSFTCVTPIRSEAVLARMICTVTTAYSSRADQSLVGAQLQHASREGADQSLRPHGGATHVVPPHCPHLTETRQLPPHSTRD